MALGASGEPGIGISSRILNPSELKSAIIEEKLILRWLWGPLWSQDGARMVQHAAKMDQDGPWWKKKQQKRSRKREGTSNTKEARREKEEATQQKQEEKEEEPTQKRQEERRKTQLEGSKRKDGRTNTKGKQKQNSIYTNSRSTAKAARCYLNWYELLNWLSINY